VIVIDASATIEVLLRTPLAGPIEERMFAPGQMLHAPHLIDVEIAQVLRRYEGEGLVSPARCREAFQDLADFPLARYSHEILLDRVWELRRNLTAYDAVYVALAEALDVPLLTRDRRIAAAPGLGARIELN
jgi:predicted nucleic acid-binding protein